MPTNILVSLSGYGGGDVSASNVFVAEALKDVFDESHWVNPTYTVLHDVFERADTALSGMKAKYDSHGAKSRFLVFGNSKGGMVARTLLARNIERKIVPPETIKCVVTHDSPHRGAVLSLGHQYFLHWAAEAGYLSKDQEKELDDSLLSKSAQQLLLYYLIHDKSLFGELAVSDDPVAELNAALERLHRVKSAGDDAPPATEKPNLGRMLQKPVDWSITARPHPERVKLVDYLEKYEPKDRWCGSSFNIGVATGSRGVANTAHGPVVLELIYEKHPVSRCGYGGHVKIWVVPGAEGVVLDTDNNVDRYFKLPKGKIKLSNKAIAWASGPGSNFGTLGKELPNTILSGIEKKVDKAHSCSPRKADSKTIRGDIAFIPTVSSLDVPTSDPFALKGKDNAAIAALSRLDAVFYPKAEKNLAHGNWAGVAGPDGAEGAPGVYKLARKTFI